MELITKKQAQKELIQFLLQHNALKPFINHSRKAISKQFFKQKQNKISALINPIQWALEEWFRGAIDYSFIWAKTNEGQKFWSSLSRSWREKTKYQIVIEN